MSPRDRLKIALGSWTLIVRFTEIESGRNADRPKVRSGIPAALVVASGLRLTRSVAFLSKRLEADVEIRFVDLPSNRPLYPAANGERRRA
jgi:hypothetical protein